MKVLAGAEQHDEGEILIRGKSVRFANPSDARKENIGIVYQDLALCNTLDVASKPFPGQGTAPGRRWTAGPCIPGPLKS